MIENKVYLLMASKKLIKCKAIVPMHGKDVSMHNKCVVMNGKYDAMNDS